MARYQNLRGTRDILPPEIHRWQQVESVARETLEAYGFREIRTPVLEATDLFVRSVGKSTDIVRKEMFSLDLGGDSMTMRPEGTAPVVRSFIQNGLDRVVGSERLYYIGPMFRYERPQKGRQRQFHQVGVEAIGSEEPLVDAETIEMLLWFLERVGVTETRLILNSVGDAACRPAYREALVAYLDERTDRLCADCRRRAEENPLRVFDCKVASCIRELEEAPAMLDHLCDGCRDHFASVRRLLDGLGIEYGLDSRMVRGLDYYVRTAFEVTSGGLGAQNALMGGGRYDGLVKSLGGKDLPGFGWALGLERLVLVLPEQSQGDSVSGPTVDLVVACLVASARDEGARAARALRREGLSVVTEPAVRSLQAHLRRADRLGAGSVLVIGEEELSNGAYLVRDMRTGEQRTVPAAEVRRIAGEVRGEA